jgi:hypothetical protein
MSAVIGGGSPPKNAHHRAVGGCIPVDFPERTIAETSLAAQPFDRDVGAIARDHRAGLSAQRRVVGSPFARGALDH